MVIVSEKRSYTTIALSKKTYTVLLNTKHALENKAGKSMSFNDVVLELCKVGEG